MRRHRAKDTHEIEVRRSSSHIREVPLPRCKRLPATGRVCREGPDDRRSPLKGPNLFVKLVSHAGAFIRPRDRAGNARVPHLGATENRTIEQLVMMHA